MTSEAKKAGGASSDAALIDDLVTANHILYDQGVLDAFGHVSARSKARPDRFYLARNMAPGDVGRDDIIEFNLDSEDVAATGKRVYAERFIHSELYRAYPDVQAVVHSHSPSVVPFTVVKERPLRPIFHMAGFIGTGAPLFEIRDTAGPATDLLISNPKLGKALAQCFGNSLLVLMRGHGSTVVANALELAVYRAVFAELNARYQSSALALGEVEYLTEAEANRCRESVEAHWQRPWDFWKNQAVERRSGR